jgi:hypothetical protein
VSARDGVGMEFPVVVGGTAGSRGSGFSQRSVRTKVASGMCRGYATVPMLCSMSARLIGRAVARTNGGAE